MFIIGYNQMVIAKETVSQESITSYERQ